VPPQQQDWWAESAFGRDYKTDGSATAEMPTELVQLLRENNMSLKAGPIDKAKLPPEILDMVRMQFDKLGFMTVEEAKEHRRELMKARTSFHEESDRNWESTTYSFCEH
jgi:hypothetical protein